MRCRLLCSDCFCFVLISSFLIAYLYFVETLRLSVSKWAKNEDLSSKCENLMNIVVESRKRFGKTCVDYDQKALLVEKKLLNLEIATTANYRFKPKNIMPSQEQECSKDMDDFAVEIVDKQKRIDHLLKRLQNTHEVLTQLDSDGVAKKLRFPLTAEAILARAKAKEL